MVLAFFAWIPFILQSLAVMAISTGIALLLRKKLEGPKPAGKEAFQLPTAEEGRPFPVIAGKRKVKSPNAVSPIFYLWAKAKKVGGGGFTKQYTAAYYYFIGLHLGVCQADIDGIKQFGLGDTCLWPTLDDPTSEAADGQTTLSINAYECWGGYKRGGGVKGTIGIQYGDAAQTLDSYLSTHLGSDQPAYRGFTGAIFKGLYIGTQPVIRNPWFLSKRTDKLSDGSAQWYSAKANIGDDNLNAIHWLRELLTSTWIGLGKSTSLLDSTNWEAAADTCYSEGYGVSIVWDAPGEDVESMVQQIEELIDGKVYVDPSDGKIKIGLIRADYDVGSLETFDEADFWPEIMATSSPGQVPSRTVVLFHDRLTGKSRPASEPDIALLARQGAHPNIDTRDYAGLICDETLAGTVAAREQQQASAMPKRFTLHALRTMAHLHETSVIKISYPELNIASMVVRVVTIDRGQLDDGECLLEVVEDVFGTAYTTYATAPSEGASTAAETLGDRYLYENEVAEAAASVTSTETGPY